MFRKLFIIISSIILTYNTILTQETNNEIQSNYFNTTINNTNETDEPAILQDIRNIETRANVSTTSTLIRAILGFILTLVGIYLIFIYLKKKSKKITGSNDIIKVLATTTIATNRYISIIEIIEDMYLISISDHNINLIEKIENKEMKDQIKMMYLNSKDNIVDDSFKNILNQTLSVFKQPKLKDTDALESTNALKEKLRNINKDSNN